MLIRLVVVVCSLFILVGCAAAYTPPPLTTAHPAHPEGMAAPQRPPSTTLAYQPSDIPASQPLSRMAQSGMPQHGMPQGMHGARPAEQGGQHTVVGEGKVIAVVPAGNQIVIEHGDIKGFMDAMTMGYKVSSPSLLDGIKAGDAIRFTIDMQNKAIVKIERLNP